MFSDEGLSESASVVSSLSHTFLFCSCCGVMLGTNKKCSHIKNSWMAKLPSVSYHKCFLADGERNLYCRVEDRIINMKQIIGKNNVKFLYLSNNEGLYLLQ